MRSSEPHCHPSCTIHCISVLIQCICSVSALTPDTLRYNTYCIHCIWSRYSGYRLYQPLVHLGKVRSRSKLQRPVVCVHGGAVQSLSSIGQCLYVGIISALEAKMAPRRHPDSPPRGIFLYILNYIGLRPFSRAIRRYKGFSPEVKGSACSAV